MAPRGRPRLTPAEYAERLQAYCRRHGVTATPAGIPPFPAGRRETEQLREWLSLYKAHARLTDVLAAVPPADGACAVCGLAVDPDRAVSHRSNQLHSECQRIVSLVEPLGPPGLDRLRAYLWPAASKRPARRKTGRTASS
jgi:hypothetical protein